MQLGAGSLRRERQYHKHLHTCFMCCHLPSPLNTQITSFSMMDGYLTHPCILNHWCGLWHAESTQWAFIELNFQMSSSSFSQQVLNCSKISNECLHTTVLNLIKNESQRGTGAELLCCCDFGVPDLCSNHSPYAGRLRGTWRQVLICLGIKGSLQEIMGKAWVWSIQINFEPELYHFTTYRNLRKSLSSLSLNLLISKMR